LVLLAGAGATAVAVAGLTCWFLQSLAGLRLVRYNLVRYPLRPDFTGAGILLTSSIPLLIMQFFSEGLFQYPLVLARHLMRDTQTVGNIAVAMQALFMVSVLPWALAQVAMPALVRSQARHDGRAAAFVEVTCRMAGLATPVFAIAAVAVGPYVVPLILGEDYALAGELLWLSMLMTGPVVVFVAAGSWLLAARHYRFSAFSAGIAVLVLLVASLILIPELGPPGVFVAAAVALLVGATIRLLPLLRTAPQSFGVQTRNAFAVAAAASIAYGVWIWLDWPRLAGALVILLLLGMAAFLWCLKPNERRSILIAVTQHAAADGNRRGEP
jgi:O-antigen/teichoic acid export membrane protein